MLLASRMVSVSLVREPSFVTASAVELRYHSLKNF